jgi:hypothetical protein
MLGPRDWTANTVFSVRDWLAEQIGCDPAELVLVGSLAWSIDGLEQGEYRRGDSGAGRVVVTGVHRRFDKPPYRIVMATIPSGQPTLHVAADEEVAW